MNKKFLSAILFGFLMVTSTGTFVSCKDYDDDIDEINASLTDLKSQVEALQSKINSGEWVSGVSSTTDGVIVTLGNGQSFTIKNGTDGKPGENGKSPKIAVNNDVIQVSYDDGATWTNLVALADLKGAAGEAAAEPIFSVGEDGHIYVQMGKDGEKKDLGVSTGGIYYVEDGPSIVLHVCDENGEWKDIVLPKTAGISSIKLVAANDRFNWDDNSADSVSLVYGQNTQGKAVEFNGVTYAKNALMTSAKANIVAQVNPTMADASVYDFYLTDSKGNSIFDLGAASAHKSDAAISRAATANKGLYVLPVTIKAGTSYNAVVNHVENNADVVFAVATKDAYGNEVLSGYELKVSPVTGTSSLSVTTNSKNVEVGKAFDLNELVSMENVIDVAYSFSKGQTAAVDAANASISGTSITGTAAGKSVKVTVKYLKNDGAVVTKTDAITIKFIAPATENAFTQTITPTGDASKDIVRFDLTSIIGNTVANSTDYTVNGVTFTAAAKDKNTGSEYAKDASAVDFIVANGITSETVDGTGYYTHTATYSVDAAKVIPGTYKATVTYGSDPVNTVTLTIVVNDPAASFDIKPLDLYFSGNNATAYGTTSAASNKISYNLTGLFGINNWNNITFSETVPESYKDADGCVWTANKWLGNTFGAIEVDRVAAYTAADKSTGNFGGAYEARALKATYQPNGNKNFEAVSYEFNLTIKSAVYEGSLTYVKPTAVKDADGKIIDYTYPAGTAKSISVVSENPTAKLTATEIRGIDKTGVAYNPKDGETDKVQVTTVALADDTSKQYLEEPTGSWENGWTIKVKANVTAPADGKTVTCYVRVSVIDQWGKVKTVDVPVTLK